MAISDRELLGRLELAEHLTVAFERDEQVQLLKFASIGRAILWLVIGGAMLGATFIPEFSV